MNGLLERPVKLLDILSSVRATITRTCLGLALWIAAFAIAASTYVHAQPAPQGLEATCPRWAMFKQCLTALSADLDGDGAADRIGLVYSPEIGTYMVAVNTKAGLNLVPFEASFDPKTAKLSLTVRSGIGDKRCRLWVDGAWCGHPSGSHEFINNVLYLSDSVHGDFAIYLTPGSGSGFNNTGRFKIVPALEGAVRSVTDNRHRLP